MLLQKHTAVSSAVSPATDNMPEEEMSAAERWELEREANRVFIESNQARPRGATRPHLR